MLIDRNGFKAEVVNACLVFAICHEGLRPYSPAPPLQCCCVCFVIYLLPIFSLWYLLGYCLVLETQNHPLKEHTQLQRSKAVWSALKKELQASAPLQVHPWTFPSPTPASQCHFSCILLDEIFSYRLYFSFEAAGSSALESSTLLVLSQKTQQCLTSPTSLISNSAQEEPEGSSIACFL